MDEQTGPFLDIGGKHYDLHGDVADFIAMILYDNQRMRDLLGEDSIFDDTDMAVN
jgi:hypothetical protein